MRPRVLPLDGRSVGAGVLSGLAVAVPAVVIAQVLDELLEDGLGAGTFLVVGAMTVAFGLAGFVAARREPAAPIRSGIGAAVATYLIVQALTILRLIVAGEEVTWLAIPLFILVAAAVGVVGTIVADARSRR